ncbi:hypothetical protein D3C73_917590 [compost metagenome]
MNADLQRGSPNNLVYVLFLFPFDLLKPFIHCTKDFFRYRIDHGVLCHLALSPHVINFPKILTLLNHLIV